MSFVRAQLTNSLSSKRAKRSITSKMVVGPSAFNGLRRHLTVHYESRCLVFLLIPQFFSKMGRYTLTCYALVLILTGPATNTLRNSEVLSESMACGQEQLKSSVKQIAESIKKPFNSMKDTIKHMIGSVKQIAAKFKQSLLSVHRLVMSIVRVMESAFSWLSSVVNICNKKVGTPYERCTRALNDGVLDCRARLGPYFSWLCNVAYVAKAACYAVKPLDVICVLVAAGIVTEIRHRAEPLLTWLSLSSCVTSLFLLLIIFRAKYYQHMFETRSRFDNRYITKELRDLDLRRARENRDTILPLNTRERAKYVDAKSFRLVASEKLKLSRSVVYMMITTFKLLVHIVADYSLYWVLMTIRYHGRFQSPVLPGAPDAGVKVAGEGAVAGMIKSLIDSLGMPLSAESPSPVSCLPDPYPPDFRRYTQIGILILLLWFSVFFEPYGLRLRHVVMGLYRPERAKARAIWLYNHILRTRAGFLKLARRKLHLNYKYLSEEKFTFRQWLDANIPCWWLRYILGTGGKEAHCLLCGTAELPNDPDRQLYRCETPDCPGIFCARCFADIGQMCTICMSPIDYGDISDVSLEKGSSAESSSTESSDSEDDIEDESSTELSEKSRDSDADDSDSSPPRKKLLSYFQKNMEYRNISKTEKADRKLYYWKQYTSKPRSKKIDKEIQDTQKYTVPKRIMEKKENGTFDEKVVTEYKKQILSQSLRTKAKFWSTSKNKKLSMKKKRDSYWNRNLATTNYFITKKFFTESINKKSKILWEECRKYMKNILIDRERNTTKPFVNLSDRDSMLEIKRNILNRSDRISYTEAIMRSRRGFKNRLIYCTCIRKTRRRTRTVPNKRIFLEETSSTEMPEMTKYQNTVEAGDANAFKLEHNAQTDRANENLFAEVQKSHSSDSSVRKAMIVNEESLTIQKMLAANIHKNKLQTKKVRSQQKADGKTSDKYKFWQYLHWSFWRNHLKNFITSNVSNEENDSRLIEVKTDLAKSETGENYNQSDSNNKELVKMSSHSWIKAHYDREVGLLKPIESKSSEDFSKIEEELKMSSLKRKVKLKSCSKEDVKEAKTFEWHGKTKTKMCSCPATGCCCKGEYAEPSADVAGDLSLKKNPDEEGTLTKLKKKVFARAPVKKATENAAHDESSQDTDANSLLVKDVHADGSNYSIVSLDTEDEVEMEEEAQTEEERKMKLTPLQLVEVDSGESVDSRKNKRNDDDSERSRFLKLRKKIKLAKLKARITKKEVFSLLLKLREETVDEASFQDLREDNFLSDGVHCAGPSQSRVSLEGETDEDVDVETMEKELSSIDLTQSDSKDLICPQKNTKLKDSRINIFGTKELSVRNPFTKYFHTSTPRKRRYEKRPMSPRVHITNDGRLTVVKWNGQEYELPELTPTDSVAMLKSAIENATRVRPERQKLLNIKYQGKAAKDNCMLSELNLKPNLKILMMGSLEEAIEGARAKPENDDVVNDLDIEEEEIDVENQEVYLAKISKRVKEYKINMLNEPRPGKKLLVLDIDYTLFDHRSVAETGYELMRPYLHEFLTTAYVEYDIVIWSATGMKWIEEKMKLLGVSTNTHYKIMFYLDYLAMITVHTAKYGTIDVKPLGVIWGKFPQYSSKNTIMFDDIRRNFIMNPKSGLKIRPFRQAHLNRDRDRELLHLSVYLRDIARHCDDFDQLNHKKWEKYRPEKRSQHAGSKRKADDNSNSSTPTKEE
ncbi:Ubiquitin-like domain-containing CTD phosphatase 1 [Eumeta japonica]|uniref:Ubiquitin-like domain-containing CTD phosphatase 1 n=1 Tax=Eumeta variegata TaxID=151549 RepID=A0A4C1VCG6_EUMVA|nr:Ubiquitin-like domain-containing CTD phosphatase 1 [Eumeta japonica]